MKPFNFTFFKKISGPAISSLFLFWLFYNIGFNSILNTLKNSNIFLVFGVFLIQIFSLFLRFLKIFYFNNRQHAIQSFEIFLMSRLGGEVSAVFYFSPLFKPEYRSVHVASYIFIDRFIEISSTIFFAIVAGVILFGYHWFISIALGIFILQAGVLIFLTVFPLSFKSGQNRIFASMKKVSDHLRESIKSKKGQLPLLVLLSMSATFLDMFCVYIAFQSLNLNVNPLFIPIVWAVGSTISALTFIGLGPSEVAWVFLFQWIFKVSGDLTGSMIILTRSTGLFALGFYFLSYPIFRFFIR